MQFKSDKWIAHVKQAVIDKHAENTPTAGVIGTVATIRYIREGLIDDIVGSKPEKEWSDEDAAVIATIRDSLGELLKAVQQPKVELLGFGANISAAAKAAGYKTSVASLNIVD